MRIKPCRQIHEMKQGGSGSGSHRVNGGIGQGSNQQRIDEHWQVAKAKEPCCRGVERLFELLRGFNDRRLQRSQLDIEPDGKRESCGKARRFQEILAETVQSFDRDKLLQSLHLLSKAKDGVVFQGFGVRIKGRFRIIERVWRV